MKQRCQREFERIPVNMTLTSTNLPAYVAGMMDLSDDGARLKLKGEPEPGMPESTISASVSLPCNSSALFEGSARVVWVRNTADGPEMGLQWSQATARAWQKAKSELLGFDGEE
jgi:PilZ domain